MNLSRKWASVGSLWVQRTCRQSEHGCTLPDYRVRMTDKIVLIVKIYDMLPGVELQISNLHKLQMTGFDFWQSVTELVQIYIYIHIDKSNECTSKTKEVEETEQNLSNYKPEAFWQTNLLECTVEEENGTDRRGRPSGHRFPDRLMELTFMGVATTRGASGELVTEKLSCMKRLSTIDSSFNTIL